ncbi:MAG: type IV pilus assembly protein PilM [Candidatus Omnitrophica bacterium]|nr:type IV pilus assembly protein PilM [Candidatus Omnitrophota bacterium]
MKDILPQIQGVISPITQASLAALQDLKSRLTKTSVKPEVNLAPSVRLACDFGRSKIAFLEIEKLQNEITVTRFHKVSRPKENDKVVEILKECFAAGKFVTPKVRLSVKGQGVVIRFVQFPKMKPEDLRGAITFEAEKYIPFKYNEVVLDFVVIEDNIQGPSGPMMNVLIVGVKRDEVYPLIQTFQSAGLEVELIDADALAFLNAIEFCYPDVMASAIGILDIGTDISTLSVAQGGNPRFIRDLSFGGMDVIKRLKRKLGLTDQAAMEQMEVDRVPTPEAQEVLKEALGNLVSDLKVSLDYYLDQVHGATPITKLFLAGGGGYHPVVIDALTKDLQIPVETLDVLGKVKTVEGLDLELFKKNQGLLTVALGLALRDL